MVMPFLVMWLLSEAMRRQRKAPDLGLENLYIFFGLLKSHCHPFIIARLITN